MYRHAEYTDGRPGGQPFHRSQDGTTVEARQKHAWAGVLAQQAKVSYGQAYIDRDGVPFDVFSPVRSTTSTFRSALRS